MENKTERWRVLFSGMVQHVGFRYTAYYLARSLELTGWVDNLEDGRVEMVAQGRPVQLRRLLLTLRNRPNLRITDYEIQRLPVIAGERKFTVRGYSD